MKFLFVHQNFPGQFRHIIKALAGNSGHQVVGIGEAINLKGRPLVHSRVTVKGYVLKKSESTETHHYVRDFEAAVRRGQEVVRQALDLKKYGFQPDVVVSHSGWGESLFLKEVFPGSRHIVYCEYFYRIDGGDVGFDPEFKMVFDDRFRVPMKNTVQLHSLSAMDNGLSPTHWQKGLYPELFQPKIKVIHEGVATEHIQPDPEAVFVVDGVALDRKIPVVTYVARNLEPYRGFHTFMRSIPFLQSRSPEAHIVIVGGDDVSYGRKLPPPMTYRELYTKEIKDQVDWSKVHVIGRVPYNEYIKVLQISTVHVYLTYPFVLSWSMLEAMAAGCLVIASGTAPVREVIRHGENGLLVDFFDYRQLAETVSEVIKHIRDYDSLRLAARETVRQRYDLHNVCLPGQLSLITEGGNL
ncbi:MAG: glycosyltransferase family 4 protein [Chlorobium sp.]|jgi:glycosyltransferase involved in cell wall biosynthesis|uniref:glycosyltransferase family 4 protein n=1 Tax=Chlorobium sp. TaxID=1095 RepID=UPI0025BD6BAB|nr:glycosyltransferase family 4 protein [Chlorobium sp.]MCF8216155.1 glycosyltransferase family 4 protein [Chlorobium sp.]MCF8271018.1 glycosyltransferase family 4 protein [Chlorobium sp.]MCF8287431.1 glycosyltransferase family 4 protein [Chlorobium sp.]MCF8290931.1 glycosyltransferase family 4 protein [Chlorobium sp.]MCF8385026.1 glycosyltransferase family 4 protein [Chlorobium sp.]